MWPPSHAKSCARRSESRKGVRAFTLGDRMADALARVIHRRPRQSAWPVSNPVHIMGQSPGEPRCRKKIVNTTRAQMDRNSLCQF